MNYFENIYNPNTVNHIGKDFNKNLKLYIDNDKQLLDLNKWLKQNPPIQRTTDEAKKGINIKNTKRYKNWNEKFIKVNNDIMKIKEQRKLEFYNEFKNQLIEDYVNNKGWELDENGNLISDNRNSFNTLMNIPVLGKILKYTGISDVLEKGMNSAENLYNDAKSGNVIGIVNDVKGIGESVVDSVNLGKNIAKQGIKQYGKSIVKNAVNDVVGMGKHKNMTKKELLNLLNKKIKKMKKNELQKLLLNL